MSLPLPLTAHRYQHWACFKCRRLFLSMEKCIEHSWTCRGDDLAQIAGDGVGDQNHE